MEIKGKYNTAKIFTDNIDTETISEVMNLLNQESVKKQKIRIMPDCHAGAGCIIGTTMTIMDKVIPNIVGVDIGCGMYAIQLEETEIDLPLLDDIINKYIPCGFKIHEHSVFTSNVKDIKAPVDTQKALRSLGTLGGGNHFIEVDRDSIGNLWLVIHTGSRHLGLEVCNYYQDLGWLQIKNDNIKSKINETINRIKIMGKEKDMENTIKILRMQKSPIPKELCYIKEDTFLDYLRDIDITQYHAKRNREGIADIIIDHMNFHIKDSFHTIHNYIDTYNMILRKGAVSAKKKRDLLFQ